MGQIVPYLFFLSCPVSMAVMMWFMMRGTQGGAKSERASPDARVAQLEREVQALQADRRDAESARMN